MTTQSISSAAVHRLIDLEACMDYLSTTGNLVRVASTVDPVHELAGIAKKFEGNKCVLFEKVKGSAFPVLMGLLWNRAIVGKLFWRNRLKKSLFLFPMPLAGGKTIRTILFLQYWTSARPTKSLRTRLTCTGFRYRYMPSRTVADTSILP